MNDLEENKNKLAIARKPLSRIVIALIGLVVLVILVPGVYLTTPLPAKHVSRLATSYLHQNFSVESVHRIGATLYLRGVHLANPPGFSKGSLASVDSIAIAPQWGDLLFGRHRFRLIALDGARIVLEKNAKGAWNFGPLQQLLVGRKGVSTETRVRQLSVKNGSVTVEGNGVQGITLQIFNLATKGSGNAQVDLAFEDAARNRFALTGKARAGSDPALDLNLSAPSLSLQGVASLLKLNKPELFAGTGSLQASCRLQKGEFRAEGDFGFSHLQFAAPKKRFPLAGHLKFAADYSLSRDAARLQTLQLTINGIVQAHAAGAVHGLKKERNFDLDLGFDDIDLALLNALLPDQSRRGLLLGGRLGCRGLHIAGSGAKVTAASGTLQLHDGTLVRNDRLLVAGLGGLVACSRAGDGLLAKGRLEVSEPRGKPLLEALDLPFDLKVSGRMQPLQATVPALSARAMGTPFSGRLAFDAANKSPLAASLRVPAARISKIAPLLQRYGLGTKSGTAAVAIELTGSGLQQLGATVGVQLADYQGSRGEDSLALKKGSVNARVSRAPGHFVIQGGAELQGLAINGNAGDARFNYKVTDSMAYLDGARLSAAGWQLSIAHLSGAIPRSRGTAGLSAFPVSLDFDGGAVSRGELEVGSLSGRFRCNLRQDPSGRWLEGFGTLAPGRATWQGKLVAAPALRVIFSRPGAKGELSGQLLGGALAGSIAGNPFAPGDGGNFDLRLQGAELAAAAPFKTASARIYPSGGLVDLHLSGAYSRRDGLSCRLDSGGRRIGLAGAGGKALLSGAAFSLAGELAREKLTVSDALLAPGQGVALKLRGKVEHPFSEQRVGSLSFSLPETAANSIIDALINLLPRLIQEASVDGTLAADGKLDLEAGKKLLEGVIVFNGGRFELPGKKLSISGLNGRFPLSLDLSGKTRVTPPSPLAFSRDNYPQLLGQLRRGGGGEVVSVAKIGLGPIEMGRLTMRVRAGKGVTEIGSLEASLLGGALLGKGFLTLQEGPLFRGDLLVNNLSLKQLCGLFPGITGYISGRVDGVLSVSGGTKGAAGLSGFSELWAHEGAGEKMLVSKEFLQRLAKQKLSGFLFRSDRSYDQAEIKVRLEEGDLSFETLKIVHTNPFGVRDLNVSMAPTQNRIALDHLLDSIQQAATRGKAGAGEQPPAAGGTAAPAGQEFKWGE